MTVEQLVRRTAAVSPLAPAVVGPDCSISYGELDALADSIAAHLVSLGVRGGDRVALWLPKATHTVAIMQAVLRLAAVYVPIDPRAPLHRATTVIADCEPRLIVTTAEHRQDLIDAGTSVAVITDDQMQTARFASIEARPPTLDDLAFILYTSGSTGDPKGVCISHRNALAFIEWAAVELAATPQDRFANHAPFHFDLSVLDLYAAFFCGASVHLIPDGAAYAAPALVRFLVDHRITIWYSVPSALILMQELGGLGEAGPQHLRAILFAGEPFPVPAARSLRSTFPDVRMLNLYGPTETNVCLFHEVVEVGSDPIPIGVPCSGDKVHVLREDRTVADIGETGELVVEGPTVMTGYWGRPPLTGGAYATGDLVVHLDGVYHFRGRKDGMVKVRGHRVELGEIDSVLHQCAGIGAAATVAVGTALDRRLIAFAVGDDQRRPTLLEVKAHCARHLPPYMVIDSVRFVADLPRTSTGKTDRRRLTEIAQS